MEVSVLGIIMFAACLVCDSKVEWAVVNVDEGDGDFAFGQHNVHSVFGRSLSPVLTHGETYYGARLESG